MRPATWSRERSSAPAIPHAHPINRLFHFLPQITLVVVLVLLAGVGLWPLSAPSTAPDSVPATEFSAERAMNDLRVIAAESHVVGSPANDEVRQYLIDQIRALGLEPQVQTAHQAVAEGEEAFRAGVVNNVVVRVPGTGGSSTIAVDGHYDSVNTGPGASDCGSCVVTGLETLRAVMAGPRLQNDLLFVFTDGEERHMLGAAAFNEQSPLAKDVKLTLNFEAQGSGGPAFLYVTSKDDNWLVSEFLKVAPDPSAYSLLATISDLYPAGRFDSDLGWYTAQGSQGLGFIYTGDTPAYHSARDSVAEINAGSIQQEGGYTLALVRHFGNLDLTNLPHSGDAVYFTVLPGIVVHYPAGWVIPLAIIISALVAGLLIVGFRRKEMTAAGSAIGFLAFLLGALATVALAVLTWYAIRTVNGNYQVHMAGNYQTNLYVVALSFASIALMATLYTLLLRRVRPHNLIAGALLGWAVLLWLLSLTVPGISYLVTWPLLFGLLPLAWAFFGGKRTEHPWWQVGVLAVAAVPAIALLPGTLHQILALINRFEGGMDFPLLGVAMLFVAPLVGLLLPHLHFLAGRHERGLRAWFVPVATMVLALALIGWANVTAGYDPAHPRPDRLAYVLNADTGQAQWVSPDQQLDDWTAQFFPVGATRADYVSLERGTVPAFSAPAPVVQLPAPEVSVVSDTTSGDIRTLQLRLSSRRSTSEMTTLVNAPGEITAATVDGRPLDLGPYAAARTGELRVIYADVPSGGWELTLSVRASGNIRIGIEETTDDLPSVPGMTVPSRPADTMPAFDYPRDPTIVARSFSF